MLNTSRYLIGAVGLLGGLAAAMAQAPEEQALTLLRTLPNIPNVMQVASPDGRFVLRAVEEPDETKNYRFNLILETVATGERVGITPIYRNVDVGWRSDGERYFLNNNLGSNVGDCEIHEATVARPALSLADAADFARLFKREPDLDHLYFSCVRWTRQDEIEVVIHGHYSRPNATAFRTRHLLWNLATGNFRPAR